MAFATIVHFDYYDYYDLRIGVEEGNEEKVIEYLKNWDMGSESEYNIRKEQPWGKFDKTYRKDNYILYWDRFGEYVGLCREL